MLGPLTYLDAALVAIALISGLLAMYRGLTRELLSIVSWIVAGLAVVYVVLQQREIAQDIAKQVGAPLPIAQIGLGAIVFLIVLILVHLVTSRISDSILDSRVGMIDRILGFCFGIVRGFLIVLILFMFYVHFFPERAQQYAFVAQAKSYDMLMSSSTALRGSLEPLVQKLQSRGTEQQGNAPVLQRDDFALAFAARRHICVIASGRPIG